MTEAKKHPGGRPPRIPGERLDAQAWVRLTTNEFDWVCAIARRERMSLSEYLRGIIRRATTRPVP